MSDLPPLPPCPSGKKGRHDLTYFYPDDIAADVTAVCDNCAMMRRVPFVGPLFAGSADDLTADEIAALFE